MAHNSGKCYILLLQHALSIGQSAYFICLSFTGICWTRLQFSGISAKTRFHQICLSSFRSLVCWLGKWVDHLILSLEQRVLPLWACCWNHPIYVHGWTQHHGTMMQSPWRTNKGRHFCILFYPFPPSSMLFSCKVWNWISILFFFLLNVHLYQCRDRVNCCILIIHLKLHHGGDFLVFSLFFSILKNWWCSSVSLSPSLPPCPCINDERGNKFWLYHVAKVLMSKNCVPRKNKEDITVRR